MYDITDRALCAHFRIAVYQVKELPEGYAPDDDPEKYMVTTLQGDFPDAVVATIPLSDTLEAAEAVAVEYLKLRERYATARGKSARRGEYLCNDRPFATSAGATAYASKFFKRTGIILGIEKISRFDNPNA